MFPKSLFLQVVDEYGDESEWTEWTHCADRINDSDVEYVLASERDRLQGLIDDLEAEVHQLRVLLWLCPLNASSTTACYPS